MNPEPRHYLITAHIALACVAMIFLSRPVPAQQPVIPTAEQVHIEQIVGNASARTSDYFRLFKNLTAEETKTVEQFRSSGEVSRQRRIVSDLIIYRSLLDNGSIAEYRDVREVDGTPIANRQERVLALFTKQAEQKSVRDELKRISREGSRYDLDYTISGLTIAQGLPLQPWARSFFDFTILGREQSEDRSLIVVGYTQAVPNPRFGFDVSLPSDLRHAPLMYQGKLWIDARTSHIWREMREVVARPTDQTSAVIVQQMEFDYTATRFGIPLPKRIVFNSLLRFDRSQSGEIRSTLQYRLTFTYGPFKEFTTSSDEGQIARVETNDPVPTALTPPEPVRAAPVAASAVPADPPAADVSLGPEFGPDAPTGPPPLTSTSMPAPRAGPGTSSRRLGILPRPPRAIPVSVPLRQPPMPLVKMFQDRHQAAAIEPPPPPPHPTDRKRWFPPI